MRNSASLAVLFAIFCAVVVLVDSSTNSYDLPIFPSAVTSSGKAKHSQRADLSRVPKLLWVSIPDDYKTDLSFSTIVSDNRNIGWEVNLCNSSCQEVFINTTFAGTSLNWAFHTVSYSYTKVDLWKYAVLYYFGGIYVDSDVEISQPLDEVSKATLDLIVSL